MIALGTPNAFLSGSPLSSFRYKPLTNYNNMLPARGPFLRNATTAYLRLNLSTISPPQDVRLRQVFDATHRARTPRSRADFFPSSAERHGVGRLNLSSSNLECSHCNRLNTGQERVACCRIGPDQRKPKHDVFRQRYWAITGLEPSDQRSHP